MEVAVSSRNCCYWPVSFKERIQAFCDLGMRKIEYHLLFEPDVTDSNVKYLRERVRRGEVEIVGVHGKLTDKRIEHIANKLTCQTISVHIDKIDLQRISSICKNMNS